MEIVLNTVKIFPTLRNRCYFCTPKTLVPVMNKLIYAFLTVVAFTSCMGSYNIEGTTDVSRLNGRMLYLKVFSNTEMQNIDSCDVVHGKFHFSGSVDSAKLGNVYMDDVRLMPLMLEAGNITIKIDQTGQLALQLRGRGERRGDAYQCADRQTRHRIHIRKFRQPARVGHLPSGDQRFPLSRDETVDSGNHDQGLQKFQGQRLRQIVCQRGSAFPEHTEWIGNSARPGAERKQRPGGAENAAGDADRFHGRRTVIEPSLS